MGLTREEVWRELLGLVQGARGDRARVPSQRTVIRWLERWVEDGLMTKESARNHKGQAPLIYRTSRALSLKSCPLSAPIPEFFQDKGSSADKSAGGVQVVRTEVVAPEHGAALQGSEEVGPQIGADTEKVVRTKNSVTEGDLEAVRIEDTPTGTTRAHAREEPEDVSPCWEAEPYPTDW